MGYFMTRGTVKVKLRPIKLAFLVNPEDKESLLKAIEINAFLWGGIYNPIIPIYNPTATKWKKRLFKDPCDKAAVSGYLDNFDPDYVVPMGECSDYPFDIGDREKVEEIPEIFGLGVGFAMPEWGIGLFEVLNHFIEEEFKFQARFPQDVCIPDFDKKFSLFLSSVFGVLSENIDELFWTNFTQVFNAKKMDCSPENYVEFLDPRKLFFTRMTELYLETNKYRNKCILLLDASNSLDIMDYWNLRALGWDVFPIPYQFMQSDETTQHHILDFAKKNYLSKGPDYEIEGRTNIYDRVPILESRSISKSKHQYFLDSPKESNTEYRISYPCIWNKEARDKYDLECCELVADTVEHEISTNQKTIEFKTIDPKSPYSFEISNISRFVNEIEFRFHDDKELFANAIPRGDNELAKVIYGGASKRTGRRTFKSCRLSKGRLVYLSRSPRSTIDLLIPQAETIFTKWMELRGWTVELSSAGRIAKQMIRQLGGVSGTGILAKRGVIELLGKMNSKSGEKFVAEEFVWDELQRISTQTGPGKVREAKSIRQLLIETKVFQLGMALHCPICTQSSWYSVERANYELQCPKCLEQFSFPPASKEVAWSYRALGPFSSPNQAHGAYTVLLTLRFFSDFSHGATTPFMSFTAKKEGMQPIEADLALLFHDPESRGFKTELIFAECKTFNAFQQKDCDRMINLGDAFPDAILVFATLNEFLRDEEKCLLRSVVDHFHKDRENNHPLNPVLILTGTELFSELHFFTSWKETKDTRAEIARISTPINLLELCDLTQHIYLDLDLWDPELLDKLSIRSKSHIIVP